MTRRLLRGALTVALLLSLGVSLLNAYRVATLPIVAGMVDRSTEAIVADLDDAMARTADPALVEARMTRLLAEEPRNWLSIDAVAGVAGERGFALSPTLERRRAELDEQDRSLFARIGHCGRCMLDASACDFSAVLLCRLPVDATPIGDVVDLTREADHALSGREVDKVALTLSVVGLAAVSMAPATGGSSLPLKAGAGILKQARRMGSLSPRVVALVGRAGENAVDWSKVAKVRSADDLKAAIDLRALRPVTEMVTDVERIRSARGVKETLYLLRHVDSPDDARRMAKASEALGPRLVGRLELLGKGRVLGAVVRHADELWFLVAGLAGLVASAVGLCWSMLTSFALRRIRHGLRDPATPRAGTGGEGG